MKHFFRYAFNSKTKFKVHSPFVFSFIENILEAPVSKSVSLPREVINYHTNRDRNISITNNAGEGSNSFTTQSAEIKRFIKNVGIPKKYGKVLYEVCKQYQVQEVVELGTSLGLSAAYLASNENIKLTTIEANVEMYTKAKDAFEALQVNNVSFINDKFDNVLEDTLKKLKQSKLIFIDGDHNKDAWLRYYNICRKYVETDTIIIFDDIYWSEGMTEAWYDISRSKEVSLSIDLYRMGILFFRKEQLHQEHFELWY